MAWKFWPFVYEHEGRSRRKPWIRSFFDAAGSGRIYSSWNASLETPDSVARADATTLRGRSRDLARNSELMRRFLEMTKSNVVGAKGIRLQMDIRSQNGNADKNANQKVEDAWARWGEAGVCTTDGRFDWVEFQSLVLETAARDGEILVRFWEGFDNAFRFAVQPYEVDHLADDHEMIVGSRVPDTVELGIERDDWNRPIAYWIFNKNPNAQLVRLDDGRQIERVPASNVSHVYKKQRAEQSRGTPWAAPVMGRLKMIDGYYEAEVTAARVAASKMGFFQTQDGEEFEDRETDVAGNKLMDAAEPGSMEMLPQGVTFSSWDPTHPTTAFEAFSKTLLRGVASGLGVSYNGFANDLEGVNFSSIRQGALDERDYYRATQQWLITHLHKPTFERWVPMAILTGQLEMPTSRIPAILAGCKWQPRGWQWVDPQKEVAAAAEAIALRTVSRTQVMAETGRSFEDTLDELAMEEELMNEAGLAPAPEPGGAGVGNDQDGSANADA